MTELKPCPFCGDTSTWTMRTVTFAILYFIVRGAI